MDTQTGALNSETGREQLDTSRELRQRRTTAGAGSIQRLEVLEAGLGPLGAVAALDPCTLVAADEKEEGKRRWEDTEGGCEAEEA